MTPVSYEHSFQYGYDADGNLCPLLRFVVSSIAETPASIEVDAALDSGAERSLFSGEIGFALGLDLFGGPGLIFGTTAGSVIPATLHRVRLEHEDLGAFELEVAFSTGEIRRNLLGRDFFDLVRVGFREHHLSFFMTADP